MVWLLQHGCKQLACLQSLLRHTQHPVAVRFFFRRKGFSFDVGATTLVDFEPGGVGGEFLDSIAMQPFTSEVIPGYHAWLPDRTINLFREKSLWHKERLARLGNTNAHRKFWHLIDSVAHVFWDASRRGIALPLQNPADVIRAAGIVSPRHWLMSRHLRSTLGDALQRHGLRNEKPLTGLLSMIVEDTVHAKIDEAPLINAAMGITMRGAGLTRAVGGMRGFVTALTRHYEHLGGRLMTKHEALKITGDRGRYMTETTRGWIKSNQVVSAIPTENVAKISSDSVSNKLQRYLKRDAQAMGGGLVVFLGIPEQEVKEHEWTHHQILMNYDEPLGSGNNMFVSVSADGDDTSAPAGHRAVMLSTHCELDDWNGLDKKEYSFRKESITRQLLENARRVYPNLAADPTVFESGTPKAYARFARRPNGAVGGVRQTLMNSNQHAIPHDIGVDGFHLVGDSTWPGLGTVACVLGSRIAAENVLNQH